MSEHTREQTGVDAQSFRGALRALAAGVTVVTTHGEHPYGVTATAVTSVSLDPPLVLVCLGRDGRAAREVEHRGQFVVNILADDQEDLSRMFARPDRALGPMALCDVPHRMSDSGCPVLEGVLAYVDCEVVAVYPAGDHTIFIGRVEDVGHPQEIEPLVLHGGHYRRLA